MSGKNETSFMMIAERLLLESSNSTSVFPLITTRPRPVRYASRILDRINKILKRVHQVTRQFHKVKELFAIGAVVVNINI